MKEMLTSRSVNDLYVSVHIRLQGNIIVVKIRIEGKIDIHVGELQEDS